MFNPMDCVAVNQLLFTTTLFRNIPEINWFAATNFCNQALSTLTRAVYIVE